jgi:hypothetical protein
MALFIYNYIEQWISTGVPQKALGVPPISEFDWDLLAKCS